MSTQDQENNSKESLFQQIVHLVHTPADKEQKILKQINDEWFGSLNEANGEAINNEAKSDAIETLKNLDEIISKNDFFKKTFLGLYRGNEEKHTQDLAIEIKGYLDLTDRPFNSLLEQSEDNDQRKAAIEVRKELSKICQTALEKIVPNDTVVKFSLSPAKTSNRIRIPTDPPLSTRFRTSIKLLKAVTDEFLKEIKDGETKKITNSLLSNQGIFSSLPENLDTKALIGKWRGAHANVISNAEKEAQGTSGNRKALAKVFHSRNTLLTLQQELSHATRSE